MADRRVHVRLVAAKPEELRRGKPRQRAIARERDQPLEPDPLLDLGALGARALVVPEDRRPQQTLALAEHDEPVHLAAEPDRALRKPRERRLRGPPPVLRILLGPTRPRSRERISLLRRGEHLAVRRDRDGLDGGRADVEPDERLGHAEIRASSIRFPNGSRQVNRGRPTSSVPSRVATPPASKRARTPSRSSTARQKCGRSGGASSASIRCSSSSPPTRYQMKEAGSSVGSTS